MAKECIMTQPFLNSSFSPHCILNDSLMVPYWCFGAGKHYKVNSRLKREIIPNPSRT